VVLNVSSFAAHMQRLLYEDRRNAWIAVAIALVALTLGAVGVHGVVSLVMARRTKEIGVRIVLGAGRGELLRLLLGKGVRLALLGAAFALTGGLAAGRLLKSQLHETDPADPWSFVVDIVVCVGVAIAASFMPAWRAAHRDPIIALRDE
jgi:ABC-type antimicrobial peptide transport system permease subunit